ncbi:PREDICTED: uncharacterized protein LOC105359948 [Ceratosolen solmsi marchali]|uniref:Uncharacterized protein LOC105359948 n=1 Tax=Ceratosolen solmsi marchali TaxID=326594 RepID=A0AAJ6VM76_9HYME|nr:PREDICTED: uncharacterized protein LOC105359948 [Ceratosolen solmsi marchali]
MLKIQHVHNITNETTRNDNQIIFKVNNYQMDYPFNPSILQKRPSLFRATAQDEINKKLLVENFISANKERMKFESNVPITWERLGSGYRIIDFPIERMEEILEHIKVYYFYSERAPLATSLFINSYTLIKYLQFILKAVTERNSFCAIEEGSGKIVGVAIASINYPFDETMENDDFLAHDNDINLLKYERDLLLEANIFETFNIDKYFCIHLICVHPDYCGNEIGTSLAQTCLIQAQQKQCSLCIGIFPSGSGYTLDYSNSKLAMRIVDILQFLDECHVVGTCTTCRGGMKTPLQHINDFECKKKCQRVPLIDTPLMSSGVKIIIKQLIHATQQGDTSTGSYSRNLLKSSANLTILPIDVCKVSSILKRQNLSATLSTIHDGL